MIKKTFLVLFVLTLMGSVSMGAESKWLTDYNVALQQAKKGNKLLLIDFAGSTWCPACMQLEKEVFQTPTFKDYASKNLVLLKVDFPQPYTQLEDLTPTNAKLVTQYNIQAFPTQLILDGNGTLQDQFVGYSGESPKDYLKKIEEIKTHSTKH